MRTLVFLFVVGCHAATPTPPTPQTNPAAPAPVGSSEVKPPLMNSAEDVDANANCRPTTHPLAESLTQETGKQYEAFDCRSLQYTDTLKLPGFVVRRSSLREDRYADTPTVPERLWSFLDAHARDIVGQASSAARDSFELDVEQRQQFIQRVPGTSVRVEGRVGVRFMGALVTEVRLSTMDVSSERRNDAIDDWRVARKAAFETALMEGLVSPRLLGMPTRLVTREHGRVIDIDLCGIETTRDGTRQSDTLKLRLAVSSGVVLEKRVVGVVHPKPDPPQIRGLIKDD